jgi:hypothetical protein
MPVSLSFFGLQDLGINNPLHMGILISLNTDSGRIKQMAIEAYCLKKSIKFC